MVAVRAAASACGSMQGQGAIFQLHDFLILRWLWSAPLGRRGYKGLGEGSRRRVLPRQNHNNNLRASGPNTYADTRH